MPPNRRAELWPDAHLPPALVPWLIERFDMQAQSFDRAGLRFATDEEAFAKARQADAVIVTKDADFPRLLERYGPPPRVIGLTFGNTSRSRLQDILTSKLGIALNLLDEGERLVEISADDN